MSTANAGSTDILDELEWRGLIAQTTDRDALRRELAAGVLTLYCGFDPTGPSLHAGHLIPLLTLRRFQQAGARPVCISNARPTKPTTDAPAPKPAALNGR